MKGRTKLSAKDVNYFKSKKDKNEDIDGRLSKITVGGNEDLYSRTQ